MEIRNFEKNDFSEISKLLRTNLIFDSLPNFLLEEKILDDPDYNPNYCFIAESDKEIIGFAMGVIRNHIIGKFGYIKFLVVKDEFRRKGIATKLYNKLLDIFSSEKCERIRISESFPNYLTPGIDPRYTEAICFFARLGFTRFNDTSNLLSNLNQVNLDTLENEKKLRSENLLFSRATQSDKKGLMEFLNENFPLWIGEVSNQFNNNPISVHVCKKDNQIIGFSGYDGNNLNTGWFGPMGTLKEYRGKNIGSILLKRCLLDQKNQGNTFSIIPWVGPIPFYMNYCNAKVDRIFWRYEKILST